MASDQQLVARILSGDTAAVPELEERYRASLVESAQKHLGMSQYEAEESVQHLFVGLLADDAAPLRRFGWRCSLSTWLHALIPRKEAIPPKRDLGVPLDLDMELAARTPAAFAGLTDRHRLILQLSAADGLTYTEIARLLRGSIGEVTGALYSAKLEFSQALGILPPPRPTAEPPVEEPGAEPEPPAEIADGAEASDNALTSAEETMAIPAMAESAEPAEAAGVTGELPPAPPASQAISDESVGGTETEQPKPA